MTTDSDVFHCQYYFPFDRNVYVLSAAAGRAQLRGAVSSPALAARVERVLGLGSGERLVVAVTSTENSQLYRCSHTNRCPGL